jgi:hypothetical protein
MIKVKAEKHPEVGDNDPVGDQVEQPGCPAVVTLTRMLSAK